MTTKDTRYREMLSMVIKAFNIQVERTFDTNYYGTIPVEISVENGQAQRVKVGGRTFKKDDLISSKN